MAHLSTKELITLRVSITRQQLVDLGMRPRSAGFLARSTLPFKELVRLAREDRQALRHIKGVKGTVEKEFIDALIRNYYITASDGDQSEAA